MGKVLIIDDDHLNAEMLFEMISDMGHDVAYTFTAQDGLRKAQANEYDVVFLDIQLPDGNGLMLLPEIQAAPSSPEVIIITGFSSPDGAELAIRNGAWDFIEKPLIKNMIELPLVRALQYREAKKGARAPIVLKRDGIVGSSPLMDTCMELIAKAAASDAPVIITGETGTGKELFARAIHNNSQRSEAPFITVDCASLPHTIIQSVLFGHEKGAFTGADRYRNGLIKEANRGTLFLDEIGELPLLAQKTFLRVLQERSFRHVGGNREIRSDFRLTVATNRDLKKMVKEGAFREDLLFRLQAFTIDLPPLRKRTGDIRELCFHYINRICIRYGKELKGISPECMDALCSYEWPGNVRELVNALESAHAMAGADPILVPKHLPSDIRIHVTRKSIWKKETMPVSPAISASLRECRDKAIAIAEQKYLQELMAATEGNISKACEISGLSRVRLYVLLKRHKIARRSLPNVS